MAVLLVISLALISAGVVPAWWLLMNSAILAAALVFERSGYHPRAPVTAQLHPTAERFVDPISGELLEVWEDSATGVREYRPSAPHPPIGELTALRPGGRNWQRHTRAWLERLRIYRLSGTTREKRMHGLTGGRWPSSNHGESDTRHLPGNRRD